ncbi:MAG TPA: hypothetical protein VIJ36_13455, partial [Thermoanaerobaculia bacterium]
MASWRQWRTWRVKRRWYERNHRRSRRRQCWLRSYQRRFTNKLRHWPSDAMPQSFSKRPVIVCPVSPGSEQALR